MFNMCVSRKLSRPVIQIMCKQIIIPTKCINEEKSKCEGVY
jgi:hypothetical protein